MTAVVIAAGRMLGANAWQQCLRLVVVLLFVKVASAAEPNRPRIIVVMPQELSSLAARISAELTTMGFDPVVAAAAESDEELAAITRRAHAFAGARMVFAEHSVRLWLFDRTTSKTLMREVVRPTDAAEARLALHAVELLRASLLELELPDAPRGDVGASRSLLEAARVPSRPHEPPDLDEPRAVSTAQPPLADRASGHAPPLEPTKAPLVEVEVGPAVVGALGNLPPYPALLVGAGLFVAPELSLGALGLIPLAATRLSAEEGSSENRLTTLALEGRWQLARGRLRPFVGLSAQATRLETRGTGLGRRLQGKTDRATVLGALLRPGLGIGVASGLLLSPQVMLGINQRYFAIDFADREAARWGPFWWSGAVALEGQFE